MAVTLGVFNATDATGWTTVSVIEPSGEGTSHVGAGTRKVYLADASATPAGNDSNAGTQAAPKLTLAAGAAALRAGDHLYLKCDSVWTGQGFGQAPSSSDPDAPTLISYYSTGARPLIKTDDDSGNVLFSGGLIGSLAIIGLEFYQYVHDPNNAGYDADQGARNAIVLLASSEFLLIEDCKFSFYRFSIQATSEEFILRRNIIVDQYSNNNPEFANSSGILTSGYGSLLVEECIFDRNGWNETLITPASVTITEASPAVVTWASNKLPHLSSTANYVRFASTGGGITASTGHYVFDNNGTTFKVIPAIRSSGVKTSGSPIITGIASTAGMAAGATERLVTGVGIPFNTTIVSVDSSSQITLSKNATASETSAFSVNPFFKISNTSGTLTNGSPVVTSITTTAMQVGATIVGVFGGIPGGTTILSIDSATQLTMSANANDTGANFVITVTPIAPSIFLNTSSGLVSPQNATYDQAKREGTNHNTYMGAFPDPGIIFRGNIYANDSCAPQQRSGGTYDQNLSIGDPLGTSFGMPTDHEAIISNSVWTEGVNTINGGAGGPALMGPVPFFGHQYDVGTVSIESCIYCHPSPTSGHDYGFQISGAGINAIRNCVMWNYAGSEIGLEDFGTGTIVENVVEHPGNVNDGLDGAPVYVGDPTLTIGDYADSIGLDATADAFLQAARDRGPGEWDADLAATTVVAWFQNNFDMEPFGEEAPGIFPAMLGLRMRLHG